jgi:hypothetical protein
MTQKENIIKAIEHLESAIDTFPDKDDEIREYNRKLEEIIEALKLLLK